MEALGRLRIALQPGLLGHLQKLATYSGMLPMVTAIRATRMERNHFFLSAAVTAAAIGGTLMLDKQSKMRIFAYIADATLLVITVYVATQLFKLEVALKNSAKAATLTAAGNQQ